MRLAGAWRRRLVGRFGVVGAVGAGVGIGTVAAGEVGACWGHSEGPVDMAVGEPSFVRTTWWGVRDCGYRGGVVEEWSLCRDELVVGKRIGLPGCDRVHAEPQGVAGSE